MTPAEFDKCPTGKVVEVRLGAIDEKLGDLCDLVTATNGRVKTLEIYRATLEGIVKGAKMTGGVAKAGWLALAGVIGWITHFLF